VYLYLLLSLGIFHIPVPPFEEEPRGTMILEVSNLKHESGRIWVGIYDSGEYFMDREKGKRVQMRVRQKGDLKIHIPDLPLGEYAIAVFHDINDNGEMDRNVLGIPSEPFSFIQAPRSKWRLPKFEEVAVRFEKTQQTFRAPLKKWWKY
jgi:uncharacterized protein (DUF2141 family)